MQIFDQSMALLTKPFITIEEKVEQIKSISSTAVPDQLEIEDIQLEEKIDSLILESIDQKNFIIDQVMPKHKTLNLIYRGSEHGYSA